MADLMCLGDTLKVDDVGGRDIRIVLLSLEPGARIWLSLDGDMIEFQRLPDHPDGRSNREYRAIGKSAQLWRNRTDGTRSAYVEELEIVERPKDNGAAGSGFYRNAEVQA